MEKSTAFILKNKFLREEENKAQQRYAEAVNIRDAKKALLANLELEFINNEKKIHEGIRHYDLDPVFIGAYSSEEIELALQEFEGDYLARMSDYALYKSAFLVAPELTPRESLLWIDSMKSNIESRTASLVELVKMKEGQL